jgi:hypothetical protein
MARRYCGAIRIYCLYHDSGLYTTHVVTPDGALSQTLQPPSHLTKAVDCPEAYDAIAASALSFADYEDVHAPFGKQLDVAMYAAYTKDGNYLITRKPQ